jgi:hypothetical protein
MKKIVLLLLLFWGMSQASQANDALANGNTPSEAMFYHIEIWVHSARLIIYDGAGNYLGDFSISSAEEDRFVPIGKILTVKEVGANKSWRPTKNIQSRHFAKTGKYYKEYYPPRHPQNGLGYVTIYLSEGALRIHHTHKRASIGKRQSNGCARMNLEDICTLLQIIGIIVDPSETKTRDLALGNQTITVVFKAS